MSVFKKVTKSSRKPSYYFMHDCSFIREMVFRLQRCMEVLCQSDTTYVELRFEEAYSLPKPSRVFEIPIESVCRSTKAFEQFAPEVLQRMEVCNGFLSLAKKLYYDSSDESVCVMNLMFVLTDHCPKCKSSGLLIVWRI